MVFDGRNQRGGASAPTVRTVVAILAAMLVAGCAGAPSSPAAIGAGDPIVLHGALAPGPHAVGFERVELIVPRRSEPEAVFGEPTVVDLYRWYPAAQAAVTRDPMTYADYYAAQSPAPLAADETMRRLRDDMTSPPELTDDAIEEVLAASLWARAGAMPAEGRFPLVLWSYRDSIPTMQPVLAEYLASHGYVVLFGWPRNNVPPAPWDESVDRAGKLEALAAQVDLLAVILDDAAQSGGVDTTRTAVLAWSYGGESAHWLQRDRDEVAVVIGIDANLVSGWVYQDVAELDRVPDADLTTPYVLLRHGRPRRGAPETPTPDLLARVPAGAWYVRLPRLQHGNFNFPGGMLPGILGLDEVSDWAVGGAEAKLGYEATCRLVLGFVGVATTGEVTWVPDTPSSMPSGFVEIERYARHGDSLAR
jgi:hypothetical protein